MKKIALLLASFFQLGVAGGAIWKLPLGITADNVGAWGHFGLAQNVNTYAESLSSVAPGNTNVNLTAAQLLSGIVQLNSGPNAQFTITLPATSAIISGLPNTIALDGTFSMPIKFVNNLTGQTGIITAGDGQTALVGNMDLASNVTRCTILQVLSSANISISNIGRLIV